ncbi:unnamed protein product [Rangifer tarandus platyrhynchus]|uniref:Uncharacterized protein n=1 Tax=Rangifer tarandus platyrhynchus TaxID=3082113 RepID=A0AC59ZE46_RANTA
MTKQQERVEPVTIPPWNESGPGSRACDHIALERALFHSLVVLGWPGIQGSPWKHPSLQATSLTRQVKPRVPGHQLLQFKGSTLASVIITLDLDRLMPDAVLLYLIC